MSSLEMFGAYSVSKVRHFDIVCLCFTLALKGNLIFGLQRFAKIEG